MSAVSLEIIWLCVDNVCNEQLTDGVPLQNEVNATVELSQTCLIPLTAHISGLGPHVFEHIWRRHRYHAAVPSTECEHAKCWQPGRAFPRDCSIAAGITIERRCHTGRAYHSSVGADQSSRKTS